MRNYLALLLIVTLSYACNELPLQSALTFEETIQNDDEFVELINKLSEKATTAEELIPEFKAIQLLIENLNKKYVVERSEEELAIFSTLIRNGLYEDLIERRMADVEFSTNDLVNAPVDLVWKTLEAVEVFPEWNPFTPRVETTFEIGSPIVMYVRLWPELPNFVFRQVEEVVDFDGNEKMCWESRIGSEFWFKTYRCYVVEANNSNSTYLSSTMHYSGVLAPLVGNLTKGNVIRGFNDVAVALKDRIE